MKAVPKWTDEQVAHALVDVIGNSRWEVVAIARGYLALVAGETLESAARLAYDHEFSTLKKATDILSKAGRHGLFSQLTQRQRTGSAENPITKLFPAAITEERFVHELESLTTTRSSVSYKDDRASQALMDFTLKEQECELPVNIKNAGTRFENARSLVGLEPDDCLPIPAYKAHGALETMPSLLYVICIDYGLVPFLDKNLPDLLNQKELMVWEMLQRLAGARLRTAEDAFVYSMTRKHWSQLRDISSGKAFHVVSARKAIRVLQKKPERTPGIGLRAWGTGARAEVNVHLSVSEDTTPWHDVRSRILANGVVDVVRAVNRKRTEVVYDPEI